MELGFQAEGAKRYVSQCEPFDQRNVEATVRTHWQTAKRLLIVRFAPSVWKTERLCATNHAVLAKPVWQAVTTLRLVAIFRSVATGVRPMLGMGRGGSLRDRLTVPRQQNMR